MASNSSQKHTRLQILRCSVQNYEWGCVGAGSQVSRLYSLNSGVEIDPRVPYAEFWIGTHDSGPSFVVTTKNEGSLVDSEITLKSWIVKNPSVLGHKVLGEWGCDLPFLFKVLSVAKALSIQAHPDKKLARVLHKSLPKIYKDGNHKPEMALALTKFEALCGFISAEELKSLLWNVPEILELVNTVSEDEVPPLNGSDDNLKDSEFLQIIFSKLMSADQVVITEVISKLTRRLNLESMVRELSSKEELVLRLERQYPGDVGVIAALFLNHVRLETGEALCIRANEPHAYITGDCIECMATSDNVVRAGLTPKPRDISTLCSMLTYKQGAPEILRGDLMNAYTTKYCPPFDEFEVDRCILPKGASTSFPPVAGPSIFLVIDGIGTTKDSLFSQSLIHGGNAVFVPANVEMGMCSLSDMEIYRAGINTRFFNL